MKKSATTENPLLRTGDLVIGFNDPSKSVYSKTGAKLSEDGVQLYGDEEDIEAKKELFVKSAKSQGASTLVLENKKPKKVRAKSKVIARSYPKVVEEVQPQKEEYSESVDILPELRTIQFENQFGKIKAKVEYLVEEDLAFMLVFSNDDMVVFEPKIGESLTLHTDNREKFEVYYPGVTFTYPAGEKKLMVLFKIPVENEE